jgi:benzoate membrane transport protein
MRQNSSSLPLLTAGFVTVLVGFTSSAAIVFQAATAAGATPGQLASWMWALGMGMGISCIGLSLRYKNPVVTAWSTPGAALLAGSLQGIPMGEAIAAFMFCAALITLSGITGWFERIMGRIPLPIAAAMLAGVLARFGMNIFTEMQSQFALVFTMFIAYLICKRFWPRYAIMMVLALGIGIAAGQDLLHIKEVNLAFAKPEFMMPIFNWQTMLSIGVPLFVVTMASQNMPGVAVIRANGYNTPISPLISWTGITTLILAPFGCFSLNLAAITAAICMGKEAHEDPAQRYKASIAAGCFYLLLGVFGVTIGALFTAFPKALVLAIAGLALLGTIANGLSAAMSDEKIREPALVTFLVTLSGVSLLGIGAAFWGLIAGATAILIIKKH